VLHCVAVCCSVLQCVAVCCSVLQCVAVCCNVLQCIAVCCSVLQLLQCVAVYCDMVQYAAVWCSSARTGSTASAMMVWAFILVHAIRLAAMRSKEMRTFSWPRCSEAGCTVQDSSSHRRFMEQRVNPYNFALQYFSSLDTLGSGFIIFHEKNLFCLKGTKLVPVKIELVPGVCSLQSPPPSGIGCNRCNTA